MPDAGGFSLLVGGCEPGTLEVDGGRGDDTSDAVSAHRAHAGSIIVHGVGEFHFVVAFDVGAGVGVAGHCSLLQPLEIGLFTVEGHRLS